MPGTYTSLTASYRDTDSTSNGQQRFPEPTTAFGGRSIPSVQHVDFVREQLEDLHRRGTLLNGRYCLLGTGALHQRKGSQGIVQFVTHAHRPGTEFAVKFFLERATFEAELALYTSSKLLGILPPADHIQSNDDEASPRVLGYPLPPMVVLVRAHAGTACSIIGVQTCLTLV